MAAGVMLAILARVRSRRSSASEFICRTSSSTSVSPTVPAGTSRPFPFFRTRANAGSVVEAVDGGFVRGFELEGPDVADEAPAGPGAVARDGGR